MKPKDELRRALQELADAYERSAEAEGDAVDRLDERLRSHARRRLIGTMALAVAVVAAVAIGVGTFTQPQIGGPMEMPVLTGVFVTSQPDDAGRCHAVRLYDTTPQDGRVALWSWTGNSGCEARSDSLTTGLGRAAGVRLASGAGIVVDATEDVPEQLAGLHLVLEPGDVVRAYPSVQAAASGTGGMELRAVERLDVPFRPG